MAIALLASGRAIGPGQVFVLQVDHDQGSVTQAGRPEIGAGKFEQGFGGGHANLLV